MTVSLSRLCSWSVPQLRLSGVRAVSVVCAQVDNPTTKSFARAVRPVKIKLITVAKGNSKGTEAVARNNLNTCLDCSSYMYVEAYA
jgi:hypothetical protein